MKNQLFLAGLVAIGLYACTSSPEVGEAEETTTDEVAVDGEDKTEESEPEVVEERLSFDPKSAFTLVSRDGQESQDTGTRFRKVYLKHELLKQPTLITTDYSFNRIEDFASYRIPKEAVFAFDTWFAGGGYRYYGVVNNGVLQIYRNYEDESAPPPTSWTLYREIDPEVVTPLPEYYIAYTDDAEKAQDLMIAFDDNGNALYAKYFGQGRHIKLKKEKETMSGNVIIQHYSEMIGGKVHGTYVLTHSGNWDYVEYTNAASGKKTKFTINHNVTIMEDTYRTVPAL